VEEDNYVMILGPGGKVSWEVQIANEGSKLISNLESAEMRVHLPSVLSFADDLVLDDAAAAAGATVSGTVDSNDVVFTISAPGISELGFTFSTAVRDDITEVSWHQSGSGETETVAARLRSVSFSFRERRRSIIPARR
jgi:hypothetical protein